MSATAIPQIERRTSTHGWLSPVGLLASGVLLGHLPMVALHLRSLWQKEQYQYFPFVIAAVVWLLWTRWQQGKPPTPLPLPFNKILPTLLLGGSFVLLTAAVALVSPWLAMVSLNIALAGVFVWLGRQRHIAYLWGIWLMLWLLVPAPLGVDNRLIRSLQRLSSYLSSTILDSIGILHLMGGNVMTLPDKQLFVDEACSGIISLMSIVACAVIYAVWRNRSFTHLVVLTVAGIVWATILNAVRICTIAVAQEHYDIDLSFGAPHEMLGLALFTLTFLALVSTDHLLLVMMAPITTANAKPNWLIRFWNTINPGLTDSRSDQKPDDSSDERTSSFGRVLATRRALMMSIPFLLLGALQLLWIPSVDTAEAHAATERALAIENDFAPQAIGPWTLESFEATEREVYSDFGRYSRAYKYRHNTTDHIATVSLDFPYLGGWHDLCVCYRNAGWTINERLVSSESTSDSSAEWKHVEGDLDDSTGNRAFILFSGFDVDGALAEPPSAMVLHRSWFRLRRRLLLNMAPQLFQVQVFTQGDLSSDEPMKQSLRELLFEIRERFRNHVAEAPAASDS